MKIFGNLSGGLFFGGFVWSFDGIFLEKYYGRIFGGRFFWEEFLGEIRQKSYLNMEGSDMFVKILVFVKILG